MSDYRKQLNASTLGMLDRGNVGLAINHHLKAIAKDVIDRPGDKGKRSMTIKITATPVIDESSNALDTVSLVCEVSQSVPKRRNSKPYETLPMADGTLQFSPTSPQDPRQLPMFDESSPVGNDPDHPGSDHLIDPATGKAVPVNIDMKTGEVLDSDDEYEEVPEDDENVSEM